MHDKSPRGRGSARPVHASWLVASTASSAFVHVNVLRSRFFVRAGCAARGQIVRVCGAQVQRVQVLGAHAEHERAHGTMSGSGQQCTV